MLATARQVKPRPWNWSRNALAEPFRSIAHGLCVLVPMWGIEYPAYVDGRPQKLTLSGGPKNVTTNHGAGIQCSESGNYHCQLPDSGVNGVGTRGPISAITMMLLTHPTADNVTYADAGGFSKSTYRHTPYAQGYHLWYAKVSGSSPYATSNVGTGAQNKRPLIITGRWSKDKRSGAMTNRASNPFTGKLVNSDDTVAGTYTSDLSYDTTPLYIGASHYAWEGTENQLLVAIWKRELSLEEVMILERDPFGLIRPDPQLVIGSAPALAESLEGFRIRYDDGDEINANYMKPQDENGAAPLGVTRRIRLVIARPDGGQYQLEAAPEGTSDWFKVE